MLQHFLSGSFTSCFQSVACSTAPLINDVCLLVCGNLHTCSCVCVLTRLWTPSQSALRLRPATANQERRSPGRSWARRRFGLEDSGWSEASPAAERARSCNLIFSLMTVMRAEIGNMWRAERWEDELSMKMKKRNKNTLLPELETRVAAWTLFSFTLEILLFWTRELFSEISTVIYRVWGICCYLPPGALQAPTQIFQRSRVCFLMLKQLNCYRTGL